MGIRKVDVCKNYGRMIATDLFNILVVDKEAGPNFNKHTAQSMVGRMAYTNLPLSIPMPKDSLVSAKYKEIAKKAAEETWEKLVNENVT